jgi:hypothetical protein
MGRDRGARSGTSSGPGVKARNERNTGDTQLSPLSAKNAGQTGLNRTTQAFLSTSTWYASAGQVKAEALRMLFSVGEELMLEDHGFVLVGRISLELPNDVKVRFQQEKALSWGPALYAFRFST